MSEPHEQNSPKHADDAQRDDHTVNEGTSSPNHGKTSPCPICGKTVSADSRFFPFCTPRCRQIDLGKWLNGDYMITRPIEQSDLDEE